MEENTLSAEVRSKAITMLTKELEEESAARASKVEAEMRLTGQDTSRIRADLTCRQRRLEQLKSRWVQKFAILKVDFSHYDFERPF